MPDNDPSVAAPSSAEPASQPHFQIGGAKFALATAREQFGFLQILVTIALSYLLLFSRGRVFTTEILEFVVLGLLVVLLFLLLLPPRLWGLRWFVWFLVLGDTVLGASLFYISDNADPGLYSALFLIILVAAYAPSIRQHYIMSGSIILAYEVVLCVIAFLEHTLSESHLMRGPVLLVLAIFYGSMLEKKDQGPSPSPALQSETAPS